MFFIDLGLIMLRIVSISASLSFLLLASSALPVLANQSLHEEFAKELAQLHSPICVVRHKNQEMIAVNHKKIIGAEELHSQGITGKGSKVIIIEAYFDQKHDDYAENLSESTLCAANASGGFWHDWLVHPQAIYQFGDHAAHITGTVRSVAPNAKLRVIDYAKEAFVPHEDITVSVNKSITKALQIAAKTEGDIVNLSQALVHKNLHKTHAIPVETKRAMLNLARLGKIIVMAAGNENIALGDDVYTKSLVALAADPEMLGRLVIVGATGYTHLKERLEGYSDKPGQAENFYITAPGSDIDGPNSYNRHALLNGTSTAAPQVAGSLALLMETAPGLKPQEYTNLIFRSARQESLNNSFMFTKDFYGNGALNVEAAISLADKEGKINHSMVTKSKEIQEKMASTTLKVAQPSLFENTKTVVSTVSHMVYGTIKNVATAVKNGISSFFGWGK